ncbi:MAG: endonuclease MutS2 [Chloroflexi bacterium]|nr:endonuclease MutS2 [Chloroflexota bacterium]MCI0819800.1 endonuclease MutS2 [Chloroflexota bacterium]MCI0885137.1 endonuclease MutS2 [Chloroflexota bacterium]
MSMPEKALSTLEYEKVIERLARRCYTERGRALAAELRPSSDFAEVLHRQRLTADTRRLIELKPNLSLSDVHDVGGVVEAAALGRQLEPQELLDVRVTLDAARHLQGTIEKVRMHMEFLSVVAERIADFREVASEIGRCIDGKGEVVDSASPALRTLRRESRIAHERLTSRLQEVLSKSKTALQEPIITLRDGRYVVPVKAELRSQLPGIVHNVSSSGATVFLEPMETVEMGNKWRELQAEEEREIARIMRDLSALVGSQAEEVAIALTALAEIDVLVAKVRYGESIGATQLPHDDADQRWLTEEPGSLYLQNARHPQLTGDVVPVSMWLGEGGPTSREASSGEAFSVLLITGPNTGGKTVAIKTVGLLALMAQAGIPVPAEKDSRLPVFDAVFADIGDEQSIEQSLSTFSSHMGNIISILRASTHRSLVLLDELAAGTDPVEGSALAQSILTYLLRIGCLTVATTHHGELKAFAHSTEGISNASVEFDAESLAPTFRLHIGLPGQSNALAIAERLGMPKEVLAEAREGISPDRLEIESLISDLHKHRDEAQTASDEQRSAAGEARTARDRVTKELKSLEANRNRLIEETRKEMEAELQKTRVRLLEAQKELAQAERLSVFERAKVVEVVQKETEAVAEDVKKVQKRERRKQSGPLPEIGPGDRIYLHDVPTPGEAISAPDAAGDLEVKLGSLRARVNVKQIESVEKASEVKPETREYEPSLLPTPMASPELDLRGLSVDEALILIDQRLDEAVRSGVKELRIIHGKGTGTLRRAVREMLAKHTLVESHAEAERRAGGDGVTVVELAD